MSGMQLMKNTQPAQNTLFDDSLRGGFSFGDATYVVSRYIQNPFSRPEAGHSGSW